MLNEQPLDLVAPGNSSPDSSRYEVVSLGDESGDKTESTIEERKREQFLYM